MELRGEPSKVSGKNQRGGNDKICVNIILITIMEASIITHRRSSHKWVRNERERIRSTLLFGSNLAAEMLLIFGTGPVRQAKKCYYRVTCGSCVTWVILFKARAYHRIMWLMNTYFIHMRNQVQFRI